MPAPIPHVYRATVHRSPASRARVEPPGDGTPWSPEHLLLSSLAQSMLGTFESIAARDGLEIGGWSATVTGTVEPTPEGVMFTSILVGIELELEIDGEVDRVEAMLEDAKEACLVLNSLRVPVVIETQIRTPADAAQLAGGGSAFPIAAAGAGGPP